MPRDQPQEPAADIVVGVSDVSVSFPVRRGMFGGGPARRVRAVQDVTFAIPRGTCFAIVGESGSGKSTLARAIVGLIHTDAGEITLDGQPISGLSARARRQLRRKVQMVLQDPRAALDPRLRVREVLREALTVHRIARDRADQDRRIEQVIRQVGLGTAHLERYANELSGGQRQRIAIARAIICEPEVLVLDEPVSALDVSIQAQIINLLVELQERLRLTYVMITHDLALVSHFADHAGVMYLGRFVEQGPVRALCDTPAHPYTASLLSVVAGDDPDVERTRPVALLDGTIPSPLDIPPGCAFHSRCPHARNLATSLDPRSVTESNGLRLPRRCVEDPPARSVQDGRALLCHFPLHGGEPPAH